MDEKTMVVKPKSLKTIEKWEMMHGNKGIVFVKSKSLKIKVKLQLRHKNITWNSMVRVASKGCSIVDEDRNEKIRPAISNDYVVYLHEAETNLSINDNDSVSFSQAASCDNSEKLLNAMKEEINSMKHNCVWDLVELPKGC